MSRPRRIAIATFGRSDFSILRPLVRLLDSDPAFDVGFWIGGAHFDEVSGRTVQDVEGSGLPVWGRVDGGEYDRSPLGTSRMMAAQLAGFASAAEQDRPDLVLILGDRFEAVAAGLAMVPLGVPVGHISGGSITEGAIDDIFRHCLTKIAAVHFCELPTFARRIQRMGEQPDRIFTTGALGLDALTAADIADFDRFVDTLGLDGLRPGFVLVTVHPESRYPDATRPMTTALIDALLETGRQAVVTYPNADPGSDDVVEVIESLSGRSDVHLVRSFGADWYPTAMAHAGLMLGNSSGGIIEAATFGLPVVDVGDRQKGRERGPNVVHSARDRESIRSAIETATDRSFVPIAANGNIYGDGRGGERVISALRNLDWSAIAGPKSFADLDPDFHGGLMEIR